MRRGLNAPEKMMVRAHVELKLAEEDATRSTEHFEAVPWSPPPPSPLRPTRILAGGGDSEPAIRSPEAAAPQPGGGEGGAGGEGGGGIFGSSGGGWGDRAAGSRGLSSSTTAPMPYYNQAHPPPWDTPDDLAVPEETYQVCLRKSHSLGRKNLKRTIALISS